MPPGIVAAAAGIALLDMVLSGDNALVIGAAAAKLPRHQRRLAIILGGLGAILFRLLLAISALELLLHVPLLRVVGAVAIFIIAIRLLLPEHEQDEERQASDRLLSALVTITIADATMSLDNVIAVAAIAHGNILVLALGVAFSMVILFVASAIVARLMDYFSWLLDLAAVVLAWTAATLLLDDPIVEQLLPKVVHQQSILNFGLVALMLIIDLFLRAFRVKRAAEAERARAARIALPAVPTANSGPSDSSSHPDG
jgi:YjbE family integral membrane protein